MSYSSGLAGLSPYADKLLAKPHMGPEEEKELAWKLDASRRDFGRAFLGEPELRARLVEKGVEPDYTINAVPKMVDIYAKVGSENGASKAFEVFAADRNRLAEGHARLGYSIAKRWFGDYGWLSQELFQESIFGLMEAAVRFDPRRGTKFTTYATWWANQRVKRFIRGNVYTVRVPDALHVASSKLTPETRDNVARAKGVRSLDKPGVREYARPSPEIEASGAVPYLRSLLNGPPFDGRERAILSLTMGFQGDRYTLRKAGKVIGLSPERVRQIKVEALEKLREELERRGIERGDL
jgi:RNA polymerase sigma factor (sigma-70 family)